MTTQTQIRRGTAAQCNLMTPADGEIIYDQTNDRLRIGDGAILGGIPLPNIADIQGGKVFTATDSGTTNHIVATISPDPGSLYAGLTVVVKVANTSNAALDLNLNGGGAVAVDKVTTGGVTATTGGEAVAGAYQVFRFDGTHWLMEAGTGAGISSITAADTSVVVSTAAGAASVKINTNNALGIGAYCFCTYLGGGNVAAGATTAGSNLYPLLFSKVNVWGNWGYVQGSALSGTWRNMSGNLVQASNGNTGLWHRVS